MNTWIENIWKDLRHAVQTVLGDKSFSVPVVASLSIGMAVTVSAFAFINALIVRPYPGVINQSDLIQLIMLRPCGASTNCWFPTLHDYPEMARSLTTLEGLSASTFYDVAVSLPEAASLHAAFVSQNYFDLLGAIPSIGHFYDVQPRDFDNSGIVISYRLWKTQFGGDPSVLGRVVRVGLRSASIIGVTQPGFGGLEVGIGYSGPDLWLPLPQFKVITGQGVESYSKWIGRRRPHTSDETIRAQAEVAFGRIASSQNKVTRSRRFDLVEVAMFKSPHKALMIGLIMSVPILILIISCVNATNLLLARAYCRQREIAIRVATGATRTRILSQVFIDSLVLTIAATTVAIVLCAAGIQLLSAQVSLPMPIDPLVIGLTLLTIILCTIGFGLAPAIHAASLQPGQFLGTSYSSNDTVAFGYRRRNLVVAQIALSFGLLIVGSQLVTSFQSVGLYDVAQPDGLFIASIDLSQLKKTSQQTASFYRQVIDQISALPPVDAAAFGPPLLRLPDSSAWDSNSIVVWRADDAPSAHQQILGGFVTEGLLRTLGFPLTAGRGFGKDDLNARVAVVNREFANRYFDGYPLGRTIRVARHGQTFDTATEFLIVGIIQIPIRQSNSEQVPVLYGLLNDGGEASRTLYIRTRNNRASVGVSIRKIVNNIDPDVPFGPISSVSELHAQYYGARFWLGYTAQCLGVIALLLTIAGLYSFASYVLSTRLREIAIRMAIGATGHNVFLMILRQSLILLVTGAGLGIPLALSLSYIIASSNNVLTGMTIRSCLYPALIVTIAMVGSAVIPAIRAIGVDSWENLKKD